MKKSIPNYLTMFRGVASLIIIVLFFLEFSNKYLIIYILFILAALSDYFDGYLARKWKVITSFGIVFDPLFDKVLVLSLLMLLFPYGIVPGIILIILFLRDITTDAFKNYLLAHQIKTPAIKIAKYKTACQMIMINFMLLYINFYNTKELKTLSLVFGILAVIFSLWSGWIYFKRFWKFYKQQD